MTSSGITRAIVAPPPPPGGHEVRQNNGGLLFKSSNSPYSPPALRCRQASRLACGEFVGNQSRPRKSAQDDRWSFCLTAGTLWPANQERAGPGNLHRTISGVSA